MTVVDADVDFGELDRQGGLGVRCLGVVHLYRTFEGHDVVALQGVDLSIRPGERVAFLGPSGSGKSTLLTLLGGIQRPSAGRILLGDAEISRLPEPELARLRPRRVSTMLQGATRNLLPYATARQNIAFARLALSGAERKQAVPDRDLLARQTFLIHNELPESFTAWRAEIGFADLEPTAIDHFDSGQIMLEAAAQGLGIAIMHDDHMRRAADSRLATLFEVAVESPYSYWFVCKPTALEERPVRLFHDWLVKAGL